MQIYKIFKAAEWAELETNGETMGAPIDLSDGFVHFSTATQAGETAAKYFAGIDGLMLIAFEAGTFEAGTFEAGTMGDALKWEISRGGDKFPHLFRPLKLSEVLWAKPLPFIDGKHVFPQEMI